jgi:outer membrane lipoprotein-sorting protein
MSQFTAAVRTALAAAILLGIGFAAPVGAEVLNGKAADKAVQRQADRIAAVRTLSGKFDILTAGGKKDGKIYFDRDQNAMRMEFEAPLDDVILVEGNRILFYGGDGTQVQTATQGTPLEFLMNPKQALQNKVDVLQVEQRTEGLYVAFAERGNHKGGQVIMRFQDGGDWPLVGWGMYDAKGGFSQTSLTDIETGVELDSKLFRVPE